MKEYCTNCMEEITSEPIEVEIETTFLIGEEGMQIEMDAPVIHYFCSQECKEEYFEPTKIKTMKTLPHKFKDENGVIDLAGINGYIQALTAVSLELNHVTTDELGEIITNTLEELRPILMEAWRGILSEVDEITEKGYDGAILQSIPNTETS